MTKKSLENIKNERIIIFKTVYISKKCEKNVG